MSLDSTAAALKFLEEHSGNRKGRCVVSDAIDRCPNHVQDALRAVRSNPDVTATAILKVLAMHNNELPGETSIRRHRTGMCACPKES